MKSETNIDKLWLAKILAQSSLKSIPPEHFFNHSLQTLPKSYHALLKELSASWQQNRSMGTLLRTFRMPETDELANLLSATGENKESLIQRWLDGRRQLGRIQLALSRVVQSRLNYIVSVLTVLWIASVICLIWVTPNYVEWFSIFVGPGADRYAMMPDWTRALVHVSEGNGVLAQLIRALLFISGPLGVCYLFTAKSSFKRLNKGRLLQWERFIFPWLSPLLALRTLQSRALGVVVTAPDTLNLTPEQNLELVLARTYGNEADQAWDLLCLPESYWVAHIAQKFNRIATIATALLWFAVAFFVIAIYQPIFQMGSTI